MTSQTAEHYTDEEICQKLTAVGLSDFDRGYWSEKAAQRIRALRLQVPAGDYVLMEDMDEGSHPKYGKGLFTTLNCVREVTP